MQLKLFAMDIRRLLNTPPRRRLPSEILETPPPASPPSFSQASTQSWDSQNGPRPDLILVQATQDTQSSAGRSFETATTFITSTPLNPSHETTRDKRIQIQTALLFKIPYKEIREKLQVTDRQIKWARKHRLTPQKARAGRHPLLYTP